jgi:hypothetical protein
MPSRAGVALALSSSVALAACPSAPLPVEPAAPAARAAHVPCAGLEARDCDRAEGLLQAATSFGNVKHEYLLDAASSIAPGRGVERGAEGSYTVLPTRCAEERSAPASAAPRLDASTIDFSYVGVAIDQRLVSADADLAPWLSAGAEAAERTVSLVALAFVRDLDPQFFTASGDVAYAGAACTCGRATHFVGAVKMGGLLSYEMRVRSSELRGRALDFVKARIAAGDVRVTQTSVGGLEVSGLDATRDAAATRPLGFRVANPVPIAYAVYPLSDVCRFSFPVPEVSPEIVEFGDVPYGQEATRLLHVVNRAPVDLRAVVGDKTFAISALGSADVPLTWRPSGQSLGCERQTREETVQFSPRDGDAPVTPKTQSVRLVTRVRTGKASFRRHEHVDTGVGRKPPYEGTLREWTCPADYAVTACRTENAQCGDGRCATDGYVVNAEPADNGCRFSCRGPHGLLPGFSSHFCRFDAVMECGLRCR